jgi:hypothetical protein
MMAGAFFGCPTRWWFIGGALLGLDALAFGPPLSMAQNPRHPKIIIDWAHRLIATTDYD